MFFVFSSYGCSFSPCYVRNASRLLDQSLLSMIRKHYSATLLDHYFKDDVRKKQVQPLLAVKISYLNVEVKSCWFGKYQ